ncbi:hypothetical protein J7E29_11545 [Streptomyces sp. ISL-90]|nr:hypothetical protein [Streptomyces sp. ISL-90]
MSNDQLRIALVELCDLLEAHGERAWSGWARRTVGLVDEERFDRSRVRGVFGGMGSLNDVVIHPANGHTIDAAEIHPVNQAVSKIRSRIYEASATH